MRRLLSCRSAPSVGGLFRWHTNSGADEHSTGHTVIKQPDSTVAIRAWTRGVEMERAALEQLVALSRLPPAVLRNDIAVMPDVHFGNGVTVGAVIPLTGAIIPNSVGVDIGCGMLAMQLSITADDLPSDSLAGLRLAIEAAVPHGRTHNGRPEADAGGWRGNYPARVAEAWKSQLAAGFDRICVRRPAISNSNNIGHLGTLGTGNHFIEICLAEAPPHNVWIVLHSGSRGVGSRIGQTFIELAQQEMKNVFGTLPSADLAYLSEGTPGFEEYVFALTWAQNFARINRELMAAAVLEALHASQLLPPDFHVVGAAVNCHHNFVEPYVIDEATGERVWLTRKGATSARCGELAIIPGSMGARTFLVRGRGGPAAALAYHSCSHGAGRRYSRGEATRRFTLADHERATAGVECRRDAGVLDETPLAYKDVDAVMKAQSDLVEVVTTLKQVVCVKG